jgi:hypothetical protein
MEEAPRGAWPGRSSSRPAWTIQTASGAACALATAPTKVTIPASHPHEVFDFVMAFSVAYEPSRAGPALRRQLQEERMRARKWPSVLSIVLMLDALLLVGFGLASYFSPSSTFATIIDLDGMQEHSLMSAVLGSLSVFYVVIGALCALAAFMPPPHDVRVAIILVVQHVWIGGRGFEDREQEWLVGNPWPDLVIHSLFVIAYGVAIAFRLRQPRAQVAVS